MEMNLKVGAGWICRCEVGSGSGLNGNEVGSGSGLNGNENNPVSRKFLVREKDIKSNIQSWKKWEKYVMEEAIASLLLPSWRNTMAPQEANRPSGANSAMYQDNEIYMKLGIDCRQFVMVIHGLCLLISRTYLFGWIIFYSDITLFCVFQCEEKSDSPIVYSF